MSRELTGAVVPPLSTPVGDGRAEFEVNDDTAYKLCARSHRGISHDQNRSGYEPGSSVRETLKVEKPQKGNP